jgi:hypothetical protein
MENNKETRKLIYSLEMIGDFSEKIDAINSADEFFKIHNRNKRMLQELTKFRNTDYFAEKVNEYPNISENELDEYIKDNNKSGNLILILGGWIFMLIALIVKTAKTRGNNLGGTKNKLRTIKSINDSIIHVIKHPGFEELIRDKNKT